MWLFTQARQHGTRPRCFRGHQSLQCAKVTAINGQALSGTAHLYQMTGPSASRRLLSSRLSIGTMAAGGSSLTITLPAYSVTTIDVR